MDFPATKSDARNKEVAMIIAAVVTTASKDRHIESVMLFGSYAKGESTATSDLDFAVVSHRPEDVDRGRIRYAVEDYDIECDFVYTTVDKISHPTGVLDVNYSIKQEGILLWRR
ncbi:MAG: nucleotidyltransferase domain-containing protein [Defluviitaleaceae bacterium]|jgi:predicted nucleotidyltransferase|nr:nucleotidyltransferase domain-containing protein [Defluviitaleaceae bacterium]